MPPAMPAQYRGEAIPQRSPRRLRVQIYLDVLRAIDDTVKLGKGQTLYRVERKTGLTHNRLKDSLRELNAAGFVEDTWQITPKGHDFMEEFSETVIPILQKYNLWQDID